MGCAQPATGPDTPEDEAMGCAQPATGPDTPEDESLNTTNLTFFGRPKVWLSENV